MLVNEVSRCPPGALWPTRDSDLGLLTSRDGSSDTKEQKFDCSSWFGRGSSDQDVGCPHFDLWSFLVSFQGGFVDNNYMLLGNKSSNFRENDKKCTSMSPVTSMSLDVGPL